MNRFYKFLVNLLTLPCRFFYPTRVIYKERYPKETKIITLTNHLKWVDVVLIAVHFRQFRHIIGKKELGKRKIVRKIAKKLEMVLIDRENPEMSSLRQILDYLKKDEGVMMFPEGTRNRVNTDLQEIKSGAAMFAVKGKAKLVPVMIYKKAKVFRKNYIYVGETFELDEFYDKPLNNDRSAKATAVIAEKMLLAQNEMREYVKNKQWKADKKLAKQEKKELKQKEKQKI